jgi:hypothetical protein
LIKAGVNAEGPDVAMPSGELPEGLMVRISNVAEPRVRSGGEMLRRALTEAGTGAIEELARDMQPERIELLIGIKPQNKASNTIPN